MKITILTDNKKSWFIKYAKQLKNILSKDFDVKHVYSSDDIVSGDIMFILSCEKILKQKHLGLNKHNIVIHPSRLPLGKGWSPLAWQILEGKNTIPFTLFEANEELDAGGIYFIENLILTGGELNEEIKRLQGELVIKMVRRFIFNMNDLSPFKQNGRESFYAKRNPEDSLIDIDKTFREQFNLLRVVDNKRYPAFFYLKNQKYVIKIEKG